jgi:anti-sigma-K factor RskA
VSDIDIHHLGAAYALDALDERERVAFEAHYPACDVCRIDVIDFRATLTHLAEASASPPPLALKDRVMADIAQTRQLSPLLPAAVIDLAERRRRRQRWAGSLMASAAAVAAFTAGALVVNRDDQPAYAAELEAVLGQNDGRLVTLTAADAGSAGSVKVAWSETLDSAVFLADDLPPAPAGKAWELWLINEDGPVAMSVLDDARDGQVRAVFDVDSRPVAWGVTLEPESGSPVPTSDVFYRADV